MHVKEVWGFCRRTDLKIPLFTARISAGFPSPADDFIDKALAIKIDCPVVPGIMPVLNARSIRRTIYLCGASIPGPLLQLVDKYEHDADSMEKAGIEYASMQVDDLLTSGVPGIHLYTMNKHRQIIEIVKNVGLVK